MRGIRIQSAGIVLASALLVGSAAQALTELDFIPSSAAHRHAANAYQAIWDEHGKRIVASLEARTCMPFQELEVAAVIADAVSHSGGPEHPMSLRAGYARDVKQSTLVHELGHRHLWQLAERLEGIDGHMTLYLVLDLVWADVWGAKFADDRVRGESAWEASYDYATAWTWARALDSQERARLWNRLLAMNGVQGTCNSLMAAAE